MKHFALPIVALFLLVGCQKDEKADVSLETSPGGIEYTRIHMPDAEDVVIQIAWPSDWALREGVNQAVPYIGTDLMLSGGAEGFPPGQVAETFADLNVDGAMWVTVDHLHGELIVPKANLSKAVEIAAAHLSRPTMDQDWFDRIQQGFVANMTETQAKPTTKGFDALRWAVLGDTPLRLALTGEIAQIQSATHADVLRWHAETVTRTNASIVIAGDITATDAGGAVDRLLSDLPVASPHTAPALKADFSPKRILFHAPDASTSTLVLMGPLPPTREGGEFEDILLTTILGGSDNSVLFDAIRTKLRASYTFNAQIDAYARNLRLLVLSGEVETAQVAEAEAVLREAYSAFRADVPVGDIAALKAPFLGQASETANDPAAVSYSALMALFDGQDPAQSLALAEVLDRVSEATLWARAGSAFPAADALIVLAVSPDAAALPGACVITAPAEAANCP